MDSADDVCAELPVVADEDASAGEIFCSSTEGLAGDGDASGREGHWVGWRLDVTLDLEFKHACISLVPQALLVPRDF